MRPLHALLPLVALAVPACAVAPLPPDAASPVFGGGYRVAPVPVAAAGPFDGLYTGTAEIDVNPNLACARQLPLGGFRVDGGHARFGGFRGDVRPDGAATLQYGQSFMSGHFAGGRFSGVVTLYPNLLNYEEYCVYRASMGRTAA